MGAGGSTAASCSSLDLTNNVNSKRNNRYQHLHQRHRNKQVGLSRPELQTNQHFRQSTSYFDLSSSHILDECDCDHGCEQRRNFSPTFHASDKQRHFAPPRVCVASEHNDPAIANIENYSISNANIGASRPIMVLPCKPISPALHLKKTNAGVASRILYQRKQQEQRYNDLRKFSDSLPSLNNPQSHLPHQNPHNQCHRTKLTEPPKFSSSCHKQNQIIGQAYSPINRNDLYPCHKQTIIPTSCQTGAKSQQQQANDYNQQHRVSSNLVNKSSEAFIRSKQRTSRQHYNYASRYNNAEQEQHCSSNTKAPIDQRQSSLKRAISLSSLHNSNQANQHPSHHHLNNHKEHMCFEQSAAGLLGSTRVPEAVGDRRASAKLIAQTGPYLASSRPNSLNSNCSSFVIADNRIKSKQQIACNHVDSNQMPLSKYNYHQPTHLAHSQGSPGPVGKKVYKYKQATPTVGNCEKRNASKSNRYKAKQQQTAQQQGCQVLPPLPRSQSLHELIQLRATENGQRMRTTGTLRGPLGSSEPANKVNLVAELLESRRQQRDNVGCQESAGEENQPTATMLSTQSLSSTDDGIHDVSILVESGNSASVSPQSSQNSSNRKSTVPCCNADVSDKNPAQVAGDNKISQTPGCKSQHQPSSSSKIDQISRCGGQPRGGIEARDKTRNQKFLPVVCGSASGPEQTHQQQLKLKAASQLKKSSQKSTLKRSLSQSALQHSGSINGQQSFYTAASDDVEHDGDESDDLNELARFLYQFKKLQANNAKNKSSTQQGAQDTSIKLTNELSPSSSSCNERANQSLQQSPSSTTSSSGFASSTCTSQSSAGCGANKHKALSCYRRGAASPSHQPLSGFNCANHADLKSKPASIGSRKKYPAPPRPNAIDGDPNSQPSPLAGTSSDAKTSAARPITGKLKLSSSLLSIVDEYQSTMQSEARQCSPQLKNANSTANLASVLMGTGASSKQTTNTSNGLGEQKMDLVCKGGHAADGGVTSNMQNEQQLNHLKRYTKLRQMSQSELALNHLINPISDAKRGLQPSNFSPASDRKLVKGRVTDERQQKQVSSNQINRNGSNASSSSRPYKSRLFNLIRRISDKTEIGNTSDGASGRLFVGLHEGGSVGGRCQQLRQDECTAWKSCQSRGKETPTGSKLGAINQIGSEKLSQSTSSYSNKPEQLDYSFVKQQQRYRRNGEERREPRSADDGPGVGAAAASASSPSGLGRQILKDRASESLCDPSFDCDFESIKNCKPTTGRLDGVGSKVDLHGERMKFVRSLLSQGQPAVIAKPIGRGVSSKKDELNLQVTVSEENCRKSAVLPAKSKSKQLALMEGSNGRQQQRAIDLVSLAGENNWKLGLSTSLSTNPLPLNATTSAPTGALKPNCSLAVDCGCGIDEQRLRTYSKSNNNNDRNYDYNKRHKSSVGLAETRRQTNNDDGCSASGAKLVSGGKLRWSAGGWFSNSAGGAKDKKRQQQEQKLKQKADAQQTKGQQVRAQGGGGRSYFDKLIPGKSQCALASSNFVPGKEGRHIATRTSPSACEEADQLLDELDQSLDLVSGASLARLTPKSWWQHESVPATRNLDATMINCSSSDDNDSEGDYASINQAMINETFDVQLADDGSHALANRRDLCMDSSSQQHRGMIFEQADSPSDSFTFSAPCSPEGNTRSSAANGVGEIHPQSNANSPAIVGLQRGFRRLHGASDCLASKPVDQFHKPLNGQAFGHVVRSGMRAGGRPG